ncbi:MAG TPA: sigma-70 family RNA polymerase sigma factor, partial [Vicinamibacteria bacterium]|nr:sigma-70 family RNA polymerase sigma factor [Vicinamibacteria bacterium]
DFRRQQIRDQAVCISQGEGLEPRSESREVLKLSVREALTRLPEPQRDTFLLREVAGLSYAEIAAIRETTIGAVRSLLHRARQTLRSHLRSEHYGNWNRNHVNTI